MKTIIIDSGGANITSILFALEKIGAPATLSSDKNEIKSADRVILPGVGAAKYAMERLHNLQLVDCIRNLKQPTLGICLGMQLLFEKSEEGDVGCLGVIKGEVLKIPNKNGYPVPHMGWNSLKINKEDPILKGISDGDFCYFVHSFYAPCNEFCLASASYSLDLCAVSRRDNFWGCQFHPEKSDKVGLKILKNFFEMEL